MAVEVTAVHMAGGDRHEHIAEVKWTNPQTQATGSSTTATMVDWLENQNGQAYVSDGTNTVNIGVVDASPKYLRTYADGIWTDNLLALPRY